MWARRVMITLDHARSAEVRIIQLILDHRKLFIGDRGKRWAFRDELAHQAIEVLVGAALPA